MCAVFALKAASAAFLAPARPNFFVTALIVLG
jgi:hypothetical protein